MAASNFQKRLQETQNLLFGFPSKEAPLPDPSISSDPRLILHLVETVWNLARPKLLVSITGGDVDFKIPPDLELVLSDLMRFARRTDAWLTTGRTYGGIIKYFGSNCL